MSIGIPNDPNDHRINQVFLIAGTSDDEKSRTDGQFDLELEIPSATTLSNGVLDLFTDSDSTTARYGNTTSKGDAVIWKWNTSKFEDTEFTADDVTHIELEIKSSNMWRPANIFVIFREYSGNEILKAAVSNWNSENTFSTDPDKGDASYSIPLTSYVEGSAEKTASAG